MKLRRLRMRRKLSQNELAKRSGVSQSYISLLEAGGRGFRPGVDVLQRLARGLGVPVTELLR